jgi:DNA ligase-associated metallophosphoesterase
MTGHPIELAGERVLLHGERALHWPRRRTLIVADTHLGKDAVFRREGLAIPTGIHEEDMRRLERLLALTRAERLVVLGDLVHGPPRRGETWPDTVAAWRARCSSLAIDVVAGNHDAGLVPPDAWAMTLHGAPLREPPFVLAHEPHESRHGHVLAGHLHPVALLRGAGERLRVPVFAVGHRGTVLPAFTGFAGGQAIEGSQWNLFAAADDGIVPIRSDSDVDGQP